MEETTTSIIGIVLAALLMFIVPLFTIADRHDDVAQLVVQNATSQFVDKVIRSGKITAQDYQNYIRYLNSSGNIYDVQMEVKILDKNTVKAMNDKDNKTIGANTYYSIYTSQIEDRIGNDKENETLLLKEGDVFSVVAKNSSKTLSQALKLMYFTFSQEGSHILAATGSGTVAVSGTI